MRNGREEQTPVRKCRKFPGHGMQPSHFVMQPISFCASATPHLHLCKRFLLAYISFFMPNVPQRFYSTYKL